MRKLFMSIVKLGGGVARKIQKRLSASVVMRWDDCGDPGVVAYAYIYIYARPSAPFASLLHAFQLWAPTRWILTSTEQLHRPILDFWSHNMGSPTRKR
jgi:hypothetical protein